MVEKDNNNNVSGHVHSKSKMPWTKSKYNVAAVTSNTDRYYKIVGLT